MPRVVDLDGKGARLLATEEIRKIKSGRVDGVNGVYLYLTVW